jgi:tRNA (uracil-5-)-methyltransferase TRM9
MNTKTIQQLNQLNKIFYQQVGPAFDESRHQAWAGWKRLLPFIQNIPQLQILDLGCGNGRFAEFLHQNNLPIHLYTGLDLDAGLLKAASHKLETLNIKHHLIKTDLITELIEEKELTSQILTQATNPNLIVMFGLLHHIPSLHLRMQLLKFAAQLLAPNGFMIFTLWKFHKFHRFHKKYVQPEEQGFTAEELERDDFLLDWLRGPMGIRYCHYSDEAEERELVASTNLHLLNHYRADGREDQTNQYILLEKV